ncbi:hypothetical protein D3C72_1523810 [compost metagenome]
MERGGGGAAQVQPMVLVEAVVLGGDQRIDDIGGDVLERDPVAVGPAVDGQLLAIGGQYLGRLLGLGLADIADARRERNQDQHIEQEQRRDGRRAQQDFAPGGPAQPLDCRLQHWQPPRLQVGAQSCKRGGKPWLDGSSDGVQGHDAGMLRPHHNGSARTPISKGVNPTKSRVGKTRILRSSRVRIPR